MKRKKNNPETGSHTPTSIEFIENLKRQWLETIDAIPDPFMIVSENYEIQKANAAMAKFAGKSVRNILGQKCHKVFAGRNKPCENCQMKKAETTATPKAYEISTQDSPRIYEVISRKLVSDDPANQGVLQTYRDRTETKHLHHRLAQQEKLASIGQLAGGFAHEINNPLGGIIVFSQMLLREMDVASAHYRDVREIELAAQRCKKIVEGLLDFARQRPVHQQFSETNFHEAVQSAVKFANVGHNQKSRCEVHVDLAAEFYVGSSDHNRIIQIILNLCTNAFQAMPEGGALRVKTSNIAEDGEKQLVIEIQDTGTGTSKENIKKIYDPFFTTKEPGQGTGLGLSIVHGIVTDLGGRIDVQSKANHGTTFRIVFPLRRQQAKGAA